MHIVIDARNRRSSTGRYTDRLLHHLQAIDTTNRYTILVQSDDPWKGSKNFTPMPCRYKQFSFNPLEQLGFAWQLYRLRPSVTHFTMTQQPLLYFGNIVTTTHDLTMLRFTRKGRLPSVIHFLRMQLYRLLFWASHRKSRAIIVPSKFVAKDLANYEPFTKNRITVTYEASEPASNKNPQKLPKVNKPFILHVGSPFPHKNIDRLIDAFAVLHEKQPSLQLVLGGKKEFYFRELETKLATNPLRDQIIIPGFVSEEELSWLYKNAEAYVLPSLSEGFGLPGLEAMAYGCPLVSSNATCLPEIYGDAAVYFDPHKASEIASAVLGLLGDPRKRKDLIKRGDQQLKKYSWKRMAEQTHKIYLS